LRIKLELFLAYLGPIPSTVHMVASCRQ